MQNSLDYLSNRSEDVIELTQPSLRGRSLEVEYELVDDDLIYDDLSGPVPYSQVIQLVAPLAPLDDPWFANEGDDVDDGVYWPEPHSYRVPVAVTLSALAAVAAAFVL